MHTLNNPQLVRDLFPGIGEFMTYPAPINVLNDLYVQVYDYQKLELVARIKNYILKGETTLSGRHIPRIRNFILSYLPDIALDDYMRVTYPTKVLHIVKLEDGTQLYFDNGLSLKQYCLHNFDKQFEIVQDFYSYSWLVGVEPNTRLITFIDNGHTIKDPLYDELAYTNVSWGCGKTISEARNFAIANISSSPDLKVFNEEEALQRVFTFEYTEIDKLLATLHSCKEYVPEYLQNIIDGLDTEA